MTSYFTTRVWTAKPGQSKQVRSALAEFTRTLAPASPAPACGSSRTATDRSAT